MGKLVLYDKDYTKDSEQRVVCEIYSVYAQVAGFYNEPRVIQGKVYSGDVCTVGRSGKMFKLVYFTAVRKHIIGVVHPTWAARAACGPAPPFASIQKY